MPLQKIDTHDSYTKRYEELIGKSVRVYTNGGSALGFLEKIGVEGITLRPSLVDESIDNKNIIYRSEKSLPQVIEINSLEGIVPISRKYLDDLLIKYHPKDENQLELF